MAQRAVGRDGQALETNRRAVELQRKLHGEDTEKLADSLNNLGVALLKAGRADEALTIYGDVLRIRTKIFGAQSLPAAKIHVNLAEANINLGQLATAEGHIQMAVRNMKLAPMHLLGNAYDTYARLAEARNSLSEAEQMRINALKAFKQGFGETHTEVATQMEKLASLLERMNRNTEGDLFRKNAAAIRAALP